MAKGRKEERSVLYRAVRFELKVNDEQKALLIIRLGDGLREIYNRALEERVAAYEQYKAQKKEGVEKPTIRLPTLFDQINALTTLREADERMGLARAKTPRNWQEETLDALDGAFKSFFALVKNGDADARPPRPRSEQYFCEIPGRSGFSLREGHVVFAPNIFGKETLAFPIPEYCRAKLFASRKVKKFTLFRDEPRLSEPGRYWVSIVYEIDKPEPLAFSSGTAVYLAVGATWLGVLSPDREEIIKLWRPDKYWMRKIGELDDLISRCTKGSLMWKRYMRARRKYYSRMSNAQKHNQREVVANKLLKLGVHFVVQDLVVRGEMADSSKPARSGALGLNWSVQNTGSIGRLIAHLSEKAKEHGGCVIEHKPQLPPAPGRGADNKLPMARRLKEDFLAHQEA